MPEPPVRKVLVKQSMYEVGVGSLEAETFWESEPTDEGAIVRLDVTEDGRYFFTFTDAEEFGGSYVSVEVRPEPDLRRLAWNTDRAGF